MKQLLFAFALVALASAAIAQEKSKVIFIRATGYSGFTTKFKCFINQKIVCGLSNNRYSIHEADTGRVQLDAQISGKQYKGDTEPFFIDLKKGKTYYIKILMSYKGLSTILVFQEINEKSATIFLNKLKQDDCF